MAKTIPFTLITPTQVAFTGEAELVIAVGTEGEEGFLAQHAPFLTALRPGVLRANVAEGDGIKRIEFATSEGFLQALPDRVTVLVDAASRTTKSTRTRPAATSTRRRSARRRSLRRPPTTPANSRPSTSPTQNSRYIDRQLRAT